MQDNEKKPALRFKGFTDPWEQRKFGEVVDKYEDPVETPHDGYYRLGIRSHAKGTFHSYVEKGHELETAQMYRVAAGNFIVNITFGWEHAVAITNESDAGKLVSHRFPQYSFHDDMLPEFFKYVIADEDFRHWLWLASPGGAGRNRVLKLDEMLNYEMVLPSKEEQQRIAAIFRNLDTLITLHQRKYEKLVNIKKSMLDKMFPPNGASVPEIRFKGFTDPWEQRKLGEICDFITKGATPTTYGFSWQPDGVPFFRNDSIKDNVFVFGEFSYISEAANEVLKRSEVHGNDILIAITGDIGKVGIIPDTVEKANINQHIARVRIRKEALPYFVYQYLASDDTQKEYQKIKTGLSMPQLSLEQVRDIVVKIPEFNEQGKIADCLRRIDTLITLHQRKLEKLQNIKKSCLEKMFV